MSTLLVSGCSGDRRIVSEPALCQGLLPLADDHNDALLVDGGPKSIVTGAKLISGLDSGCDT